MRTKIESLAAFFHRGTTAPSKGRLDGVGSRVLLASIAVPVFALIVLMTLEATRAWREAMPKVPIPRDSWRVVYDSSPMPCSDQARRSPGCLASPDSDRLWQAPDFRDAGTHRARVMTRVGKDFWLGTTVPAEVVRAASEQHANRLIIGYFNADYEVWIDGHKFLQGTWRDARFPAIATLPPAMLETGQPLKIGVRLAHTVGSLFPDTLATNRHEGFTTAAGAEAYLLAETIENQTRPALFLGSYLVLGLLALGFWASHTVRSDFFYVGLYALFHAGLQIFDSNVASGFRTLDDMRIIRLFTLAYEGGLALAFGLAWARTRRDIMRLTAFTIVPVPWLILVFADGASGLRAAAMALHQWFVPSCYALGAAACLLQMAGLTYTADTRRHLRRRAFRLAAVAAALFGLSVAYWLEASAAFSMTEYAAWYRLSNIGIVAFFFVLGVFDFSEMDRLVRHAPLSKYHRINELPASVTGALVNIDVKNSEVLIQKGAERGQSGHFLLVCLSHMWAAVTKHGGIVLQTDGDALVAFFEHNDEGTALDQAANALLAVGAELASLSEQYIASGVLPQGSELHVRGAIAFGAIKPVWQEAGGQRSASWTGVGSINLFLETARLLELERQIEAESPQSNVVIRADAAEKLSAQTRQRLDWAVERRPLTGKHDKAYSISAFVASKSGQMSWRKAG